MAKPRGAVAPVADAPGTVDGYSYEDAISQEGSNHWSVTEYNSNNAWNVNFGSGNVNNNNKYNGNVARAVTAYGELSFSFFFLPRGAWNDKAFASFFLTVWDAYRNCLHGKMSSPQAVEYMQIALIDLPFLAWELWTGTYHPGTSTCFLVKYPKLREVFAAAFRDRIVHHWVCIRLEPLFEERFESQHNVSFNCRKGYGTDAAVEHAAAGMEIVSDHYQKKAWVFRGDLVGFFMSINKELLWYLLERFIIRWRKRHTREGWQRISFDILARLKMDGMPDMYWDILLQTTKIIVMHHPECDCVLNSPADMWGGLAPNKSLFTSDTGEPIGNLTTQLFANFLMSFFDMYVLYLFRHGNIAPHLLYERFVDDFDVKCDDESFLLQSIPKMESFLHDKLKLELHKDKRYFQEVSHGMLFVGTYIKPGRLYLSNRTLGRLVERCHGFRELMEEKGELNVLDCQRIEQVINSYLGFCKGRETYAFRRACIEDMGKGFWKHFYVKGHFESIRTRRRYRGVEA